MDDRNAQHLDLQGRLNKQSIGLDPAAIFSLLKKNWYCYTQHTMTSKTP